MIKKVVGAAALLTLVACSQEDVAVEAVAEAKPLSSGIDIQYMDTSVNPGDDFFMYVNGKWVQETEIPADRATFGGFQLLADEAQEDVKAIIDEASTGDFEAGSDEQKVGDLYNSYMDMETRNSLGVTPLDPIFNRIAGIDSKEALAAFFAWSTVHGVDSPIQLFQFADLKNPDFYAMNAVQGGIGLPEREYYFNDDERSVEIRAKYVEHVGKILALAGHDTAKAEQMADQIMALETAIAAQHMTKEKARDFAGNYTKLTRAELSELMPNFAWDAYFAEIGLENLDALVVFMTDYLGGLDGVINDTDLDTWQTYLTWAVLNQNAAWLTEDLDNQNFDFYARTLAGVERPRDRWRRGVNMVNGTLGEVVGKVYVSKHFPPEAKERMVVLVQNLINAYEKSIKELEWMSDATKVEALDKLYKFSPKIGYPDRWRDYSALEIQSDDLIGNTLRAASAEWERQLDRQDGPVDKTEWGMSPQTVNAYYNPAANEIVFPAAILQPPFFNLEADEAVNYGAIGAVIGHEIGHGFDDKGSTFDGDGKIRNWWTDEDRAEFEARTRELVAQYDSYYPFEDVHVNGAFTLGENIGDLGGISIGLLAYQMSLEGEEPPVIDGFTGEQRVFLGYGQVWRMKAREEALRQQIATDPHSPAKYRANGPVRNVPAFYEAFDVTEDQALYLAPEDRVKIW